MQTAKQVHYEGRVQGIGFRATVRHLASGFDVSGSVANLPDGRVRLVAEGDAEEVDAFLQDIRDSSLAGHIEHEAVADIEPTGARGFHISA